MWLSDEDYIKFLTKPKKYLSSDIKPYGYGLDIEGKKIPKCICLDIILNCSHYRTHKEAIQAWNRRKKRVNFNNIVVIFITDNNYYINKFIKLPYEKKDVLFLLISIANMYLN